jgi:tungstate transport system substrate-binding protein
MDTLAGVDMSEQTGRNDEGSMTAQPKAPAAGLPPPEKGGSKTTVFVAMAVVAILIVAAVAGVMLYKTSPASAPAKMILATTTSTQDSGLLDYLKPKFDSKFNIKTNVISVGSGQALALGQSGDADVLLVHSKAAELTFVQNGYGLWRKDVMYNWFMIIGPKEDPALIKGMNDTIAAFKTIYNSSATFCSRGDNSGTYTKELGYWKKANITVDPKVNTWYLNLSQGMGETLITSNEKKAYTLSDSGTWYSMSQNLPNLQIVLEGDKTNLLNQYGVIPVNGSNGPHVHTEPAMKFANWILGPEGQDIIAKYQKGGMQLFFPNAS